MSEAEMNSYIFGSVKEPTLADVIECARKAGETAMEYFRCGHNIGMHNKLNDSDIVTIADKQSETVIKSYIQARFPDHAILSEESGETDGTAGYRWVVDPIDGTTNFFAGIPFWAISIGVEHDGLSEIGVVYLPATGELFHAVRGQGAFLNGNPIHISSESHLSRCVISTGFPVDKDTNPDNNLDNLAAIMPLVRDIRRLGSAASDICYVAAGFLDGYWELNLHEWDVNAATLILEEAGGKCTRFRTDRNISLVCGSQTIHDQLLSRLNPRPATEPESKR